MVPGSQPEQEEPFVLAVAFAGVLSGQSADSGILGTVTDQNGAAVAGAAVMISSQALGFSKSVITGPDGQYELRYLLPEDYVVEVRNTGFRPEPTPGITLRIGQLSRVDFKSTVAEEQIVGLPLNGRNYVTLGNLTPGWCRRGRRSRRTEPAASTNSSRTRHQRHPAA